MFNRNSPETSAIELANDEQMRNLVSSSSNNVKPVNMVTLLRASELTGLSYEYLRKACLSGKYPYVMAGRKMYINYDVLYTKLNEGLNNG